MLAVEGIRGECNTIWETVFFAMVMPSLITLFGYCLRDVIEAPMVGEHFFYVGSGTKMVRFCFFLLAFL